MNFKILFLFFAVVTLSGCIRGYEPIGIKSDIAVPASHAFSNNIIIHSAKVDAMFWGDMTDEQLRETLVKSLDVNGFLAGSDKSAEYQIDAVAKFDSNPPRKFDQQIDAEIKYSVTNIKTGENIIQKTVKTSDLIVSKERDSAGLVGAFLLTSPAEQQNSYYQSYATSTRRNVKEFMNMLSRWNKYK